MLPGTFDLATPDQRLAGFRINHLAEWYRRCGSHPLAVGLAMLHALRCLVGRLPCSERFAPLVAKKAHLWKKLTQSRLGRLALKLPWEFIKKSITGDRRVPPAGPSESGFL